MEMKFPITAELAGAETCSKIARGIGMIFPAWMPPFSTMNRPDMTTWD